MQKLLIPPVWFVLSLAAMALLDHFLPVAQVVPPSLTQLGMMPIFLGCILALWAAWLFRRAGTPVEPWKQPVAFVDTGPYRFSRNPMYLGLAACLLGSAVLFGSLTAHLAVAGFVWVITVRFIRREETLLSSRFGAEYGAYKARVRRWI